MLTVHLLLNDPATPPDVLAWLARSRDLNATDALTLATRQDFPAGAALTVERITDVFELPAALTHPDLPAHHRAAFIAAANTGILTQTIANHDCFTPDELTAIYATTPPTRNLIRALAANAHTPTPLAAELIALLRENPDKFDPTSAHLTDITALTHHLTPTTPEALAAATTPDPLDAYARNLAHLGRTQYATDGVWWERILLALAHPTFTTAALTHATTHNVTWHVHFAIACNHRMPDAARRTSANAIDEPALSNLGATADPDDLHPDQDTAGATAEAIAWYNPNVTAKNLRDLHAHATTSHAVHPDFYLNAIALHPRTPHDLRATATTALTAPHALAGPAAAPLTAALVATHAHPTTALDEPWPHLHGRSPTDENTRHLNHWARQAWAHTPRPTTTLEYAQALTALDSNSFTVTMRELLTTAASIAAHA